MHLERNRAQASGRRRPWASTWPSISFVRDGSCCVGAKAMPTYAYPCEQCRETFKRIETISERAEVRIAQLSRVGFVIGHLE
jgi:hypothetical protein